MATTETVWFLVHFKIMDLLSSTSLLPTKPLQPCHNPLRFRLTLQVDTMLEGSEIHPPP